MPTTTVNFSNRPQHRLEFTVTESVGATTTDFAWSLRILTSGNTLQPYGTGSYSNSTSPTTSFVSGTANGAQSFNYDYRSPNQNRTYSFPGGVRRANRGTGNYTFTMTVTMGSLIGSATAQVTVSSGSSPVSPPSWTTTSMNEIARVGSSFSFQLQASGSPTYALASGSLPPGLNLNSSGLISGTPTAGASQAFNFRVNATNAGGTAQSNEFTINRRQAFPVWTDNVLNTSLRVGDSYGDSVSAANATSYSAVGLPQNGISLLNSSSGNVQGTPITTSTISFTITASNSDGDQISQNFNLTPLARLPVWSDDRLNEGGSGQSTTTRTVRVGQSFNDQVVGSFVRAYGRESGSLPPGITLNTSFGTISGTPTTVGTYIFDIFADNSSNEKIFTPSLTIIVQPAAGGKVWNGTTWVQAPFRVWNGSTWVEAQAKVWNGTTWVDPVS